MDLEVPISFAALIVSVAASAIALLQTRRVSLLNRMPILVFVYDGSAERWVVHNVGRGPAINIVIAQQADDGGGGWYNPVGIPAIAADATFTLDWLGDTGDYSLGARYGDFLDRRQESRYFSYTRHDRCSVHPPGRLPRWIMPTYDASQISRHWNDGLSWERPGAAAQLQDAKD